MAQGQKELVTLIDTHCHINFDSYDNDRSAVIERAAQAGVTRIINPAVDLESTQQGIALAQEYEGIFAAVGIHPNSTANFIEDVIAEMEALASETKIVAIGEIGLDYYWDKSPKTKQFEAFEAQLALAARLELPVIIHNREASDDVMQILEQWARDLPETLKPRPGVLHSFSAPQAIAERALAAGFYLGFTGPLTFKKADDLRRIAANTPLDRILLETDGPFLTPAPHRGKRNEPAYIPYIADRLAAVKQTTLEAVTTATTQNAETLFNLPKKA
ncbi:MAG: hydrolase TatD [Phototrophicales bacterium]|nr:MAG: hydrolase TatD [Phototrophicales bacterium]